MLPTRKERLEPFGHQREPGLDVAERHGEAQDQKRGGTDQRELSDAAVVSDTGWD